jgi:hypothetical protein
MIVMGRGHMGDIRTDGRIILKGFLEKYIVN